MTRLNKLRQMVNAEVELRIELDKPTRRYLPGEEVSGHVIVSAMESVDCKRLRAKLEWVYMNCVDPGPQKFGTVASCDLFRGQWQPGSEVRYPFVLVAPRTPLTYRGKKVSVFLRVVAEADIPYKIDVRSDKQGVDVVASPEGGIDLSWGSLASDSPFSCALLWVAFCGGMCGLAGWLTTGWVAVLLVAGGIVFGVTGLFAALAPWSKTWPEFKMGPVQIALAHAAGGDYRTNHDDRYLNVQLTLNPDVAVGTAEAVLEVREKDVVASKEDSEKSWRENILVATTSTALRSTQPGSYEGRILLPPASKGLYSFQLSHVTRLVWELHCRVQFAEGPDYHRVIELKALPALSDGDQALPPAPAD